MSKRAPGQDAEETFDLIEPTGAGRREVECHARICREPRHHVGRRVSRRIVDDDVKVGVRVRARDLLQKSEEIGTRVAVGDAMDASPIFPPMVVEMVKIGEQTGKLDESLIRVSEYFEREVEQSVKTLTTLMEPIIMVFLAIGVGFLIFAVITPIYNLMSAL